MRYFINFIKNIKQRIGVYFITNSSSTLLFISPNFLYKLPANYCDPVIFYILITRYIGVVANNIIYRHFYTTFFHQKTTSDTTEFKYFNKKEN